MVTETNGSSLFYDVSLVPRIMCLYDVFVVASLVWYVLFVHLSVLPCVVMREAPYPTRIRPPVRESVTCYRLCVVIIVAFSALAKCLVVCV